MNKWPLIPLLHEECFQRTVFMNIAIINDPSKPLLAVICCIVERHRANLQSQNSLLADFQNRHLRNVYSWHDIRCLMFIPETRYQLHFLRVRLHPLLITTLPQLNDDLECRAWAVKCLFCWACKWIRYYLLYIWDAHLRGTGDYYSCVGLYTWRRSEERHV